MITANNFTTNFTTINMIEKYNNYLKKIENKSRFLNKVIDKISNHKQIIPNSNVINISFYLIPKRRRLLEKMVYENQNITNFLKNLSKFYFSSKIKSFSDEDLIKKFIKWIHLQYQYRKYKKQKRKYKKVKYKEYGIKTKIVCFYLKIKNKLFLEYLAEKYEISISEIVNLILEKVFKTNIFEKIIKETKDEIDWVRLISELEQVNLNSILNTEINKIIDSPFYKHNDRKINEYVIYYIKQNKKNELIDFLSLVIWFYKGKNEKLGNVKERISKIINKHWKQIRKQILEN